MPTYWVLVADAAKGRLFSRAHNARGLTSVEVFDNPPGRMRDQEISSDKAGRYKKGGKGAKSAMDPHSDPHENAVEEFAHELNKTLEAGALRNAYDHLVVVAPARFMGMLRKGMGAAAGKRLESTVTKDLSHMGTEEVESHLGDVFRAPHTSV